MTRPTPDQHQDRTVIFIDLMRQLRGSYYYADEYAAALLAIADALGLAYSDDD